MNRCIFYQISADKKSPEREQYYGVVRILSLTIIAQIDSAEDTQVTAGHLLPPQ
jgi:hypothetical protein